jgi:hypothetical protein
MSKIQEQPARKYRGKSIVTRPIPEKAEILFNDRFKTFNNDLSKATPAQRLNATIQLAGYLLTSQKEQNENTTKRAQS